MIPARTKESQTADPATSPAAPSREKMPAPTMAATPMNAACGHEMYPPVRVGSGSGTAPAMSTHPPDHPVARNPRPRFRHPMPQTTASRSIGQDMQRGPPRPRPSSDPAMVTISMPCLRRNVLDVMLRS